MYTYNISIISICLILLQIIIQPITEQHVLIIMEMSAYSVLLNFIFIAIFICVYCFIWDFSFV